MYNATDLVYKEFLEDFDHYISSFLQYRYTSKYSDIPLIGDKIYKRYFSNGKLRDPLNAVKVSIECILYVCIITVCVIFCLYK